MPRRSKHCCDVWATSRKAAAGAQRAACGEGIVATLWRQLSWSHFRELLPLKRPLQREFYAEMCRIESWSVRALRERIDSMLYERTALSRKPEALIREELAALRAKGELQPQMVLKDPYVLDFLGLTDRYVEKDLEDGILRELESFLLELGTGFSAARTDSCTSFCSSISTNSGWPCSRPTTLSASILKGRTQRRLVDHCFSSTITTFARPSLSSAAMMKSIRFDVRGTWYSIPIPTSPGISSS